jgi:hypothetical protein
MKHVFVLPLALAVVLCYTPAFAQHGHGGGMSGGMGASMGSSMGHGGESHSMTGSSNSRAAQSAAMTQQLSQNKPLAQKIEKLTGMSSAQQACEGFKNLGQCVAAAHVSNNLKISFACLRADMTGTAAAASSNCGTSTSTSGTSGKTMSLGKAIQTLDPNVNAGAEAKKAQKQADQDLKNASNS